MTKKELLEILRRNLNTETLNSRSTDEPSKSFWRGQVERTQEVIRLVEELNESQRIKELEADNRDLLELSENLDEHPEGYEGPCLCMLCKSYG